MCAKNLPISARILGVDLEAIKPVRGARTIVDDITTQRCRERLRKESENSLFDVVLHDGAPNVGGAFASEMYTQVRFTACRCLGCLFSLRKAPHWQPAPQPLACTARRSPCRATTHGTPRHVCAAATRTRQTQTPHLTPVQSALVLDACKLACEFLRPEGTFVTKVFRSRDYTALLYAFRQLFARVEATKPQASRNTSAEIFVVCRGFKAPAKLDPRLLDHRTLFQVWACIAGFFLEGGVRPGARE